MNCHRQNNPPITVINTHVADATKQMRIISHDRDALIDTSVYQMNKTQISHFFAVHCIQEMNLWDCLVSDTHNIFIENNEEKQTFRF